MHRYDGRTSRTVAAALGVWGGAAITVGASGLYSGIPAPIVGATNAALVTLMLLSVLLIPPLRVWGRHLPLRWLVVK